MSSSGFPEPLSWRSSKASLTRLTREKRARPLADTFLLPFGPESQQSTATWHRPREKPSVGSLEQCLAIWASFSLILILAAYMP